MANVIQIKRSSSTNVPTTLEVGELAYSSASDKLFIGEAGSLVTEIAGGAAMIKLAAIESGATADMTGAEIKVAYEGEADTNAFNNAFLTKLTNIETGADVTDATNVAAAGAVMESDTTTTLMGFVIDEDSMATDTDTKVPTQQSVKAYVDSQVALSLASGVRYQGAYDASTNSPDLDSSPIANITTGDMYTVTTGGTFFAGTTVEVGDVLIAEVDDPTLVTDWTVVQANLDASSIKSNYESNSDTNAFTDAFETKLTGIEALATADQTDAEIKTAYENNSDTNVFTDAEKAALALIEPSATADQTDAEIKTAYENNADTNVFDDAEKTKLGTVESNADVTDSTNVAAAITATAPLTIDASAVMAIDAASTTATGIVQIATQVEVDAGTDALKPVTAATLHATTIDGGTF